MRSKSIKHSYRVTFESFYKQTGEMAKLFEGDRKLTSVLNCVNYSQYHDSDYVRDL